MEVKSPLCLEVTLPKQNTLEVFSICLKNSVFLAIF